MAMLAFNNLFAKSKSHSDAFLVDICLVIKLAKQLKKLVQIFFFDAMSFVSHLNIQLLFVVVVAGANFDRPTVRKLERVFYEVYKHLL